MQVEAPPKSSATTTTSTTPMAMSISAYAAQYSGMTKIKRLRDITTRFPQYRDEALFLLQKELADSFTVDTYKEVCDKEGLEQDEEWIRRKSQEIRRLMDAANTELSNAKSSSNKESIRLGYMEQGNLLMEQGNFFEASRAYDAAREFAAKPQHHVESYFKLIVCSLNMSPPQQHQALSYANKIESEDPIVKNQVKAAQGLCYMLKGDYRSAAKSFVDVDTSVLQNTFSHVISSSDVALYGCLCALSSMDLQDLKRLILESKTFKIGLDQIPYARSMLQSFCSSLFGDCLTQLRANLNNMSLDMYLHTRLNSMFDMIMERILLQYCQPYSSLDLQRMSTSLKIDLSVLESDLAKLIGNNKLNYRIDSAKHQFHRKVTNDRDKAIDKITALNELHASAIRQGTLRLSLMQHNVGVFAARGSATTGAGSPRHYRGAMPEGYESD